MSEDTISRQVAIDAFYKYPNIYWTTLDVLAKIDALPSAQPEPCEDTINRQMAIDAVEESRRLNYHQDGKAACAHEYEHRHFLKLLRDLPSAQPEPCGDVVSRNAIVQKLNEMNRYVSTELKLCDTDKKFPQNEVFIVDDVYEEIVENLPPAQPEGWLEQNKDKILQAGMEGREIDFRIGGRLFAIREKAQ